MSSRGWEVRAIVSVAKGLRWFEFSVSWVKVEVVVEVWVLGGCWAGGFAHYLAWLRI